MSAITGRLAYPALALFASLAHANEAERSNGDLETIVVTAQKRVERLQDVPISISVLGGVDLDRSTVKNINEELRNVPGVATAGDPASARAGGFSQVIIRGVSPGTGSSTTAYYLDSIPFGTAGSAIFSSMSPDPSAYDLDRVEVLRGPQGTLYGLSASNGVVRVLTKDADLTRFDAKARGSVSSTERGGQNYRGDLAVNVPLVEDKLAARVVLGYQDWSGWIDKPIAKDANSTEQSTARIKLNAQATEQLSFGGSAWLSRSDNEGSSVSPDGRVSHGRYHDPSSQDFEAYSFKARYELPGVTIESNTSYLDYRIATVVDFEHIGIANIQVHNDADATVLAEEVVVNSTGQGPWRWTAGAIYRDADVQSFQLRMNPLTGAFGSPYLAPNIQKNYSESFAAFGELTRAFFDGQLELTGGLRYFEDTIRARELSSQNVVGGVPPGGLIDVEETFDSVTPRAVLSWLPNDRTTVYASYGEGFRSGVIQSIVSQRRLSTGGFSFPAAESDLLKNYEIGTKGSAWDGRVKYEAAVFYMDWQDVQQAYQVLVQPVPFFTVGATTNATSASGAGAELSAALQPIDGFTVGASLGWNELTVDRAVFDAFGAPILREGQRLIGSPAKTASLWADYEFDIGQGDRTGRIAISGNYVSEILSAVVGTGLTAVSVKSDEMIIARASFSMEVTPACTATAFVDNFTNENGIAARDAFSPEWYARVRPRTIGLQFDYRL
jgi:outer membrane receptor protein involved in Fe transport